MKLTLDGHEFDVQAEEDAVVVDGQRYQVSVKGNGLRRTVTVNGRTIPVDLSEPGDDGGLAANVEGKVWQVRASGGTAAMAPVARPEPAAATAAPRAAPRPSRGAVTAQMAGRVLRVEVKPGDQVEANALLLILEAMKMENEIRAPRAGTVKSIPVSVGDRVNSGDALVEFEEGA
ncbi:MAG: biotin/lipoyl-containing protein [Dehalococcoidia bacterium]